MENATVEIGEPNWGQSGSAWWHWLAPFSGMVTIDAKSADPGYVSLAVFGGDDLASLELVRWNNNFSGGPEYPARVVFKAHEGVAYPIAIQANGAVILSVAHTEPPLASVVEPTPSAVYRAGDTVSLHADTADVDGFIRSVEFILDAQSIGTVTNAPFCLLRTFYQGDRSHSLRVRQG